MVVFRFLCRCICVYSQVPWCRLCTYKCLVSCVTPAPACSSWTHLVSDWTINPNTWILDCSLQTSSSTVADSSPLETLSGSVLFSEACLAISPNNNNNKYYIILYYIIL